MHPVAAKFNKAIFKYKGQSQHYKDTDLGFTQKGIISGVCICQI